MNAADAGVLELGSDLTVNRMGFGSMQLTGPGTFGPPADRDECIRVLRRAIQLGVNFIDTADSYGPNVAEELIAEALHPYPNDLVIGTKAGFERPGPGNWVVNGRPEHLRAGLQGSLKRLKLERIDLWQLHRIDKKVPEDEQFGAIAELVREGFVRHVGLSEVNVDQIERARKAFPVVSVQNQYNVVDRRWNDVVDYCERENIAFIPWFPLGGHGGALTEKQSKTEQALEKSAKRHNASIMQVALAWLLVRSPMMLVIPGTSKVEHLEENVAAAALDLGDSELGALQ